MAVSKVVYDGEALIDLTEDSVTPTSMLSGTTAHDASGEQIEGELMTLNGTTEETPNSVAILVPYSDFGDATAEDVLAGKTFTSSAGLRVVGTGEVGGGESKYIIYGTQMLSPNPEYGGVENDILLDVSSYGVYGWFYYDDDWHYGLIESIVATSSGFGFTDYETGTMLITSTGASQWKYYDEVPPDDRYRVIDFTTPVEVTKEFYEVFTGLIANDNESPYDVGYDVCTEDMQDDLTAQYNSGFADGVTSVEPELYGSYTLAEIIEARSLVAPFELELAGSGVMAYFWDGAEHQYAEVSKIAFTGGFNVEIRSSEYGTITYTTEEGWKVGGATPTDQQHRVITFTIPTKVPPAFYQNWFAITRNSAETSFEIGEDVGYDKGYAEGEANGGGTATPVLYGTYLLKESIDYSGVSEPIAHFFTEVYDEDYAYCYPEPFLIERSPIRHIEFEPDQIMIIPNHVDLHLRYQIATGYWEVVQEVDYDEYTQPFPAERCRILEFNKPYEVSQEFYDLFMSIIDNTDGTAYGIGHTEGVKTQYDEFWDAYQDNGNRTDYRNAFIGYYWNQSNLKPKYTCKVVGVCTAMFQKCFFSQNIVNTTNLIDISHISIDVTEATECIAMFADAMIKEVNLVFGEKVTSLNTAFTKGNRGNAEGMKITLLVPNPNCDWTNAFSYHKVKELNLLDGTVIGTNGFNVRWATGLPRTSIASIIRSLSSTTTGLSITLSLAAVNKAYERSEGANDGSSAAEWSLALAAAPNWTINLI